MLIDLLIKYYFRLPVDFTVPFGTVTQKDSIYAVVFFKDLWITEPISKKIKSLLTFQYEPERTKILLNAQEIMLRQVFGFKQDYGIALMNLMAWHHSKKFEFNFLTDSDKKRIEGLNGMTILTRTRFREQLRINLSLNIWGKSPQICSLCNIMVVKIPVMSLQFFLDVHVAFAFNSIRKANHPFADELISYLYDILFLGQKIAISLHDYSRRILFAEERKNEALFINAEINAVMGADLIFSYLKASVEKTIVLIGLTHGIKNLESKKTHKSKIDSLNKGLDDNIKGLWYSQIIFEFIKSENLDDLNNYRTGILHKKGISDLQPHNYVGAKANSIPLRKILETLHSQHAKNTAILICALALLTDNLVKLDHPKINPSDIPKPINE
ncbi:MAG: hypothetical protein RIC80_19390 [Cyclobacteriaceae bacterium]